MYEVNGRSGKLNRGAEVFRVPEGYSFVVTDLLVHAFAGLPSSLHRYNGN